MVASLDRSGNFPRPAIFAETSSISRDCPYPFLGESQDFLSDYDRTPPLSEARNRLCRQYIASGTHDLGKLVFLVGNVDLVINAQYRDDDGQIPSQFKKRAQAVKDELAQNIEDVAGRTSLDRWSAQSIEELFARATQAPRSSRGAIEAVKKGVFRIPENIRSSRTQDQHTLLDRAVVLYYQAATAMVTTEDPKVREEIFSTLVLETEILAPTSLTAQCFELAAYSLNDRTISKREAALQAIKYTGALIDADARRTLVYSPRLQRRSDWIASANRRFSSETNDKLNQIKQFLQSRNPGRYAELQRIYFLSQTYQDEHIPQRNVTSFIQELDLLKSLRQHREYAISCGNYRVDPLTNHVLDRIIPTLIREFFQYQKDQFERLEYVGLTETGIQFSPGYQLFVYAQECLSREQRNAIVQEVYQDLHDSKPANPKKAVSIDLDRAKLLHPLDVGHSAFLDAERTIGFSIFRNPLEERGVLDSVLEFHRPEITPDQQTEAAKHISQMRDYIRKNFKRLIGRRGWKTVITDPKIRQYGYQSFTFRQNQEGGDIHSSVRINNREYNFNLTTGFNVVPGRDIKKSISPPDLLWLQLLAVSQLKKLMCVEEDQIEENLYKPNKQREIYRRQTHGIRKEHLRDQSLGRGITKSARDNYEKSGFPKMEGFPSTLDELNKQRGRLDKRIHHTILYVKADSAEKRPKQDPIRIAFAFTETEAEEIKAFLPLTTNSPEELARMERMIFGDLIQIS